MGEWAGKIEVNGMCDLRSDLECFVLSVAEMNAEVRSQTKRSGVSQATGCTIGSRGVGLILAWNRRVQSALLPSSALPPPPAPISRLTRSQLTCLTPVDSAYTPSRPMLSISAPAIRFAAAKGAKSNVGTIQLLCHVKPGVNASREGIAAVSDERVEVCIAAQAKDGEANKAVRQVIADALRVAKSDIEVIKGMKSREKIVSVRTSSKCTPEEEVERIRIMLGRLAGA